ncbi:MAG TPA: VOC family protein [Clostridia bacterium]|nr:VOC family protein [Clostridia bacterium]
MATVRYLVTDVDRARTFYLRHLGFEAGVDKRPAFAVVQRGDLVLWLAGPASSAARPMPDGRRPEPGGWNRFVIEVDDIEAAIAPLREAGVPFRSKVLVGPGGKQVLVDDPDGNVVEIFEPSRTPLHAPGR